MNRFPAMWSLTRKFLQNSSSLRKFYSTSMWLRRLPPKNYYKILGVDGSASSKDIKTAYIRLVKIFHPDTNSQREETKKHFQDIVEAYEVLSDRQKRMLYDKFGVTDRKLLNLNQFRGVQQNQGSTQKSQQTITTREYFNELPKLNDSAEKIEAEVTFLQAIRGGSQVISLNLEAPCLACEGVRRIRKSGENCPSCSGTGKRKIQKDVKVMLPENLKTGQSVVIPSPLDPNKSLNIQFTVNPGTEFRQEGFNVHSTIEISLSQALLGHNVTLRGVYGDHQMRIPPGLQSNTILKLSGRGIRKNLSSTEAGDHYVTVIVVIPRKLTRTQIDIIKEFAKTEITPKKLY